MRVRNKETVVEQAQPSAAPKKATKKSEAYKEVVRREPKPYYSPVEEESKPHSKPMVHLSTRRVSAPRDPISDIIENCDLIVKWWNGVKMEKAQLGDVEYFKKLAESAGIEYIGEGGYGSTYVACKGMDCNYIIKLQNNDINFIQEVKALYALNGWEYTPVIYDAWTCDNVGFIVIERLKSLKDCTYKSVKAMQTDLQNIVDGLHQKGIIHNDLHLGNLLCKNGHIALIDFGLSMFLEDKPRFLDFTLYREQDMLEEIQKLMTKKS
jgi:hypothetical protein